MFCSPLSERKVCERSSEWRDALDFFAEMQRRQIQQECERKDSEGSAYRRKNSNDRFRPVNLDVLALDL